MADYEQKHNLTERYLHDLKNEGYDLQPVNEEHGCTPSPYILGCSSRRWKDPAEKTLFAYAGED